jgi:hypothetical protein
MLHHAQRSSLTTPVSNLRQGSASSSSQNLSKRSSLGFAAALAESAAASTGSPSSAGSARSSVQNGTSQARALLALNQAPGFAARIAAGANSTSGTSQSGQGILTIDVTQPVSAANTNGAAVTDPVELLKQAMQQVGLDPSSVTMQSVVNTATYPGGSYTDRQIQVQFPGGRQESYSTDLVARNASVAAVEMKRMLNA